MRTTKNAFAQSDKGPHCSPDANYKVLILFRLSALAFFAAHMSRNVRKRAFGHVRPAKIQISLRIFAVSQSSQGAFWLAKDANFLNADNEDSDQSARMHRLIWVFIGSTYQKICFLHICRAMSSSTRWQRRPRSDCAFAQSDQGLRSPLTENETIECGKCLDLNAHAQNESNSVHFMFVRNLFAWRGPYMGLNRQHFHSALLFSADSRRAVVSFCRKNVHNTG